MPFDSIYSVLVITIGGASMGSAIGFMLRYRRYKRNDFHGGALLGAGLLTFLFYAATHTAFGEIYEAGGQTIGLKEVPTKELFGGLFIYLFILCIPFMHVVHWFFRKRVFRFFCERLTPELIGVRRIARKSLLDILQQHRKWSVPLEGLLGIDKYSLVEQMNKHKDAPKRKVTVTEVAQWRIKTEKIISSIEQSIHRKVELEVYW